MITKKDIPLNLLKVIEPLAQENLDIIKFKPEENTYYCFVETDSLSRNYFKIFIDGSKHISNHDKLKYVIELKPRDQTTSLYGKRQENLKEVENIFKIWLQLVRDITDIPSVHDDNFTKKYAEFFFKDLKLVEADANISPFNPDQQDAIELCLGRLNLMIQSSSEIPVLLKEEIKSQISGVTETLETSPKNEVMRNVSKIWGTLYKHAKKFAQEVIAEVKKELVKKLIDLGVEYGPKVIQVITDRIHSQ